MSTLNVDTINDRVGTGQPAISGLAKAWVNFNGTGTVAIRASYNVSSITDNGTGYYTVNLTTAMPDENFSVVAMCGISTPNTARTNIMTGRATSTSAAYISCYDTAAAQDAFVANVAIFR